MKVLCTKTVVLETRSTLTYHEFSIVKSLDKLYLIHHYTLHVISEKENISYDPVLHQPKLFTEKTKSSLKRYMESICKEKISVDIFLNLVQL